MRQAQSAVHVASSGGAGHRILPLDAARDFSLDRMAVGLVVFGDNLLSLRARQPTTDFGMQLAMPD